MPQSAIRQNYELEYLPFHETKASEMGTVKISFLHELMALKICFIYHIFFTNFCCHVEVLSWMEIGTLHKIMLQGSMIESFNQFI